MEAKILAARWSSHVRSPENTAVWFMTPNPAMNRTHKQRRFACRLCAGYRKPWADKARFQGWCQRADTEIDGWIATRKTESHGSPHCSAGAKIEGFKDLQRLRGGDAHMSGATRDDVRRDCEGPTAPLRSVPILGPPDAGYLKGLTTRTPSKSSKPGKSSE